MEPHPITRVDVWHLENLLFKLFHTIQELHDSNYLYEVDLFSMSGNIAWIDRDTQIAEYFEHPYHYEYDPDSSVQLDAKTFLALRNFIIEHEDIGLALDLTEQELNLHAFIVFLKDLDKMMSGALTSIPYLEMLRDFRYELYKWACFVCNRKGSSIDREMKKRKEETYLIAENMETKHIKYIPEEDETIDIEEETEEQELFDLTTHFIKTYDKAKILIIYKRISVLAYEKDDKYISKILSILACAHYKELLSSSYAKTAKSVMAKFHIPWKSSYGHPATYGKPSEKGITRAAYQEALDFFATL